jgi:rod shape determining protein RodA
MALLQRLRPRDVHWAPLLLALLLTAFGVLFVVSATYDPDGRYGLGREAQLQFTWWLISGVGCLCLAHVSVTTWKAVAYPLFGVAVVVQVLMSVLGPPLVPVINGQSNWLVLGPLRIQPSEFIKLAMVLACARLISTPGFEARRLTHVLGALALAGVPAAIMAKGDLGSALTFPPVVLGMLLFAGMRYTHLAGLVLAGVLVVGVGISRLPHEGPKAYQYQRIQAFLHPEDYALTEGYQTLRSTRSIGSGQITGKGWAQGEHNRMGWLPEKHTDMIFAVVGEEWGFIGTAAAMLLFLGFGWSCLHAAILARDPFGRLFGAGFVCLVIGSMGINVAVATGLMPVTGIALPFFSYGGSHLLGTYLGLGILLATGVVPRGGANPTGRAW